MKRRELTTQMSPVISTTEYFSDNYNRFNPDNSVPNNSEISSPTAVLNEYKPQRSNLMEVIPVEINASANRDDARNLFNYNTQAGWASGTTYTYVTDVNQASGEYRYTSFSNSTVTNGFNITIPKLRNPSSFSYTGSATTQMMDNKVIKGAYVEFTMQPSIYLSKYKLSGTNVKSFLLLSSLRNLNKSNIEYGWTIIDIQRIDKSDNNFENNQFMFNVTSYEKSDKFRIVILELFTVGNFSGSVAAYINKLHVYGSHDIISETTPPTTTTNGFTTINDEKKTYQIYIPREMSNKTSFAPFSILDEKPFIPPHINKQLTLIEGLGFSEPENSRMLQTHNLHSDYVRAADTIDDNALSITNKLSEYASIKRNILNISENDYLATDIPFYNKKRPTLHDGMQDDLKTMILIQNNVYILGTITMALLLIGTITLIR
jgi:hypothetical protein